MSYYTVTRKALLGYTRDVRAGIARRRAGEAYSAVEESCDIAAIRDAQKMMAAIRRWPLTPGQRRP